MHFNHATALRHTFPLKQIHLISPSLPRSLSPPPLHLLRLFSLPSRALSLHSSPHLNLVFQLRNSLREERRIGQTRTSFSHQNGAGGTSSISPAEVTCGKTHQPGTGAISTQNDGHMVIRTNKETDHRPLSCTHLHTAAATVAPFPVRKSIQYQQTDKRRQALGQTARTYIRSHTRLK